MARASKFDDHRDQILALVFAASASHAKAPSVRSLADEAGVAVATMHLYLQKLADEGMVEWRPGRHRSLHLTQKAFQELSSQGAP